MSDDKREEILEAAETIANWDPDAVAKRIDEAVERCRKADAARAEAKPKPKPKPKRSR